MMCFHIWNMALEVRARHGQIHSAWRMHIINTDAQNNGSNVTFYVISISVCDPVQQDTRYLHRVEWKFSMCRNDALVIIIEQKLPAPALPSTAASPECIDL